LNKFSDGSGIYFGFVENVSLRLDKIHVTVPLIFVLSHAWLSERTGRIVGFTILFTFLQSRESVLPCACPPQLFNSILVTYFHFIPIQVSKSLPWYLHSYPNKTLLKTNLGLFQARSKRRILHAPNQIIELHACKMRRLKSIKFGRF
jgi:hypothetical protein